MQNGQFLTVTTGTAIAGTAFFLEDQNLVGAFLTDQCCGHFGGLATHAEQYGIAIKIDGIAVLALELFDLDNVVFRHFILLTASADNCEHNETLAFLGFITDRQYTHGIGHVKKMDGIAANIAKPRFFVYSEGVSPDPEPMQGFALNRKQNAAIIVYGDAADRKVTKLLWGALGTPEIKIINIDTIQELIEQSLDSLLNVIVITETDDNIDAGLALALRSDLVGDIMAIIDQPSETVRRIKLLEAGYDAAFNLEMVDSIDFHKILSRKIDRARTRFTHRLMQDEYVRFREAMKASPDAFIVFDDQKRIFFVSEHYKRAYPRIAGQMIRGLPVMEAFELARREQGVSEDDPRYEPMRAYWEKLDGQIEFPISIGGERKVWRVNASRLENGLGYIVTTTDITTILTQRHALEKQSRQLAGALEKEQEASAMQKQFIAMVSHEFRTPLAIIDGHAQMLMRRKDEEATAVEDRLKTIRSAVSRLVHMMESVLSSNLLKTGRMEPVAEDFDLRQLIAELCNEQMILAKPDSIRCDCGGLPPVVRLDQKMMTLILSNLLSNAVKFTPENPVITVKGTMQNDLIVIEISDNGVGIPADEADRIFDRYYRATTSTGIPGTGIGLSLVRDLAAAQGGRIDVDSAPGRGTRFTLSLRNINGVPNTL